MSSFASLCGQGHLRKDCIIEFLQGDCDFENSRTPLCSWEIVPGDLKFVRVRGRQNTADDDREHRERKESNRRRGRKAHKGRKGEGRNWEGSKGEGNAQNHWESKRPSNGSNYNKSKLANFFIVSILYLEISIETKTIYWYNEHLLRLLFRSPMSHDCCHLQVLLYGYC